jgi:hypothetical protein
MERKRDRERDVERGRHDLERMRGTEMLASWSLQCAVL